jgi:hypothetical protein
MASAAITNDTIITKLRDEYSGGSMYGGQSLNIHAGTAVKNNGFMGSENIIFLSSKNSITHEAPACIAANLVTMVAKNTISMGLAGQGKESFPVRLCVPSQLSITTKHLSIGEVMLLVEPEHGFISCKKLTLLKPAENDPENFEVIKSWVMNDDAEIEYTQ